MLWNGTSVDGHSRYEIFKKLGIPFKTEDIDFQSREEAKAWIINNWIARRNLSEFRKIVLTETCDDILRKSEEFLQRNLANLKNVTNHEETVDVSSVDTGFSLVSFFSYRTQNRNDYQRITGRPNNES